MSVSTRPKGFDDVEMVIMDGTSPSPVTLTLVGVMNDFKCSNIRAGGVQNAVTRHESRGRKTGETYGNREYLSGSFTFQVMELSDAAPGALTDFILKQAAYSGNVSVLGDGTRIPYMLDLEITILGALEYGDSDDHAFTLRELDITIDYADGDPNIFTVNFTADRVDGDLNAEELAA